MSDNEKPEEPLSEELANAPAALAVRCPGDTCNAEPGQPCRTSTGAVRARAHLLRWLATPGGSLSLCVTCGTPVERLDDGASVWWVHLRHPEDGHDAVSARGAIDELVTAVCHTVDYVGNNVLPAKPGWSWYDALAKYAPEQAQRYVDQPVLIRRREETGARLTRALETLADNLDRRARRERDKHPFASDLVRELHELAQGLRALVDGGDVYPVTGDGYAPGSRRPDGSIAELEQVPDILGSGPGYAPLSVPLQHPPAEPGDREPQPGDGPQYHDEHRAWKERQQRQHDEERCSQCGHSYPTPVELHHDEIECVANQKQQPSMATINVMGYPISVPASLARALGEDLVRESTPGLPAPRAQRHRGPGTVVTICGSTRFRAEMAEANHQLTLAGHIVLAPGVFRDPSHAPLVPKQKEQLDAQHLDKIDMSSWIYVVNIGGYIGDSTRREIEYAQLTGKEVVYHEVVAAP